MDLVNQSLLYQSLSFTWMVKTSVLCGLLIEETFGNKQGYIKSMGYFLQATYIAVAYIHEGQDNSTMHKIGWTLFVPLDTFSQLLMAKISLKIDLMVVSKAVCSL